MKGKEILEAFNSRKSGELTLKFTEKVDVDGSSQWEHNMKADIVDVYNENGIVCIHIDSSNYIEFNKTMQKKIWFNSKTMKYDATRDEFLANEDDSEVYDDILYVKLNDYLDIIELV